MNYSCAKIIRLNLLFPPTAWYCTVHAVYMISFISFSFLKTCSIVYNVYYQLFQSFIGNFQLMFSQNGKIDGSSSKKKTLIVYHLCDSLLNRCNIAKKLKISQKSVSRINQSLKAGVEPTTLNKVGNCGWKKN